jgi:hypothetical protein
VKISAAPLAHLGQIDREDSSLRRLPFVLRVLPAQQGKRAFTLGAIVEHAGEPA